MDIRKLKEKIENKDINNISMIWVLTDDTSDILVHQYIKEIIDITNYNLKIVDSVSDIDNESFIVNNLYFLRLDEYDGPPLDNSVIVCRRSKSRDAIKIPKVERWQLIDYLRVKISGVKKSDIDWIESQSKGDYFRIINEADKISIFNRNSQQSILNQLIDDNQLVDLTSLTIWDLVNGIIRKDKKLVLEVLKVIDYIDIEPLGLLKALYNGFKNVINIQLDQNCDANKLGMSGKQFFVVKKYNCNHYTKDQLINIFNMLTSLEYKYKFESLEFTQIIDYIIINTIGV